MPLRWLCWLSVFAVTLAVPPAVFARWYQVEVIAFRHSSGLSTGGEQWAELSALPDFANTVDLIVELPDMDDEPTMRNDKAGRSAEPIAFSALEPREMHLAGVERRLRNSSSYEVLSVSAWRQPSFGVRRARRIYLTDVDLRNALGVADIASGDLTPPTRQIEGIVSIKVSRLLHIEIDYLYYHEGTPIRLSETRKAKLREIHYFDHPLFGVVVQVSPYVIPSVPTTADVAADEPEDPDATTTEVR
jgi:hypothetical protein